jgi:hypothetical protein
MGGRSDPGPAGDVGDGPATGNQGVYGDSGRSDYGQFRRRAVQNQKLQGAGFLGKDLGMNIGEQDRLAKFGDFIKGGGIIGNVLSGIFSGGTGKVKPPLFQGGGGGDNQTIPYWAQLGFSSEEEYLASLRAQAPSDMDQEPEEEDNTDERFRRFKAEGGIMNSDVVGGEFDFESARQMYGLGKLVKKVTRTVKKIAKSPIGKAALLYAGTAGLGSLATGGGMGSLFRLGTYAPSSVAANFPAIFTKAGAKNILFGGEKLLGNPAKGNLVPFSGIFGSGGKMSAIKAIGLTSAAAGLLTPEQEDEAQTLADNTGIDIEKARNSILAARREQYAMDARARGFKADGGLMRLGYQEGGDAEPVAKKTMPLLDMDGKEKDYRETGGFVDMGRMERADDVPARLSKNEFVFTADAVRNAGDGSVDKGAEVMYNMMKNLEAGGEVSEESQGLEGARKMFQTSQRLEEVL